MEMIFMAMITRKGFLSKSITAVSGLMILPGLVRAGHFGVSEEPLDRALVKEFVTAAHVDDAKTKAMLDEYPALLNSVHNLGSWDWEDAVGAAGHMGHIELARFLLAQGARMTICVAAMLGELSVVQSMITAFPYMRSAVGPHRISLLSHAKYGGDVALPVVAYLDSLGVKE